MAAVLGIAKALFDYASQQPNPGEDDKEVSIEENETLYILERGDDGWWKVRKKAEGEEEDGEEGLVPANYVEEATPMAQATAMYDYERQTSEEINFQEGSRVEIYDKEDPDWFLVGCNGSFGFAPSNYLEETGTTNHSPAVVAHQATSASLRPDSAISLIPQAPPLPPTTSVLPVTTSAVFAQPSRAVQPDYTDHTALDSADDGEPNPPTPNRPSLPQRQSSHGQPPISTRPAAGVNARIHSPTEAAQPSGRYRTWQVQEVEGKRKKRKGTLGLGDTELSWAPDKTSESIQTWPITSLIRYSTEKKHVFVDLQAPPKSASFDFHAGSSDVAAEINQCLGELVGAARAPGIREIAGALKAPLPDLPPQSGLAKNERENGYPGREHSDDEEEQHYAGAELLQGNEKHATVLYDFEAQGDDEVTVRAGARVVIVDDRASPDWWKIRVGRREGVIPADYLEAAPPRKSSKKKSSSREEIKTSRPKAAELKAQATGGKTKPDPKKVRSWTDRSRSFRVDAQLLGCSDGKIHLHKSNGVKISVPVSKMCSEDIEYVEHKIGRTLREDVPLADVSVIAAKNREDKEAKRRASVAAATANKSTSDFDWFDFFLAVGCDPNVCQRYTSAFERDGLTGDDVTSLEPGMLRTLGVKEGDILKIGRAVDARLGRSREAPSSFGDVLQREERDNSGSGLLSGPAGELKNNTRRGRPERNGPTNDTVDASALKSNHAQQTSAEDAWTVKAQPRRAAAISQGFEDLSLLDQPLIPVPAQPATPAASSVPANYTQQPRPQSVPPPTAVQPQSTAYPSQQFLHSIQQMQPQKTNSAPAVPAFMPQTTFGSAIVAHKTGGGDIKNFVPPPLYPHQTGYQQQQQQLAMMQQMAPAPYQDPFKTGSAAPYQDPFKTGIAPMPTGFPIQQTSFTVPMQPTGFMPQQSFVPQQQPMMYQQQPQQQPQYGFMQPQTTFNMQSQQTGFNPAQPFANSSLPAFGGQLAPQQTGFMPQQSSFMPQQTGFMPQQTGFAPPPQQFGMQQAQPIGGYPMQQQQQQQQQQQPAQPQMSAGMMKMQEMMAQAQAQQPAQPGFGGAQPQQQQGAGGFQPISFGRSASAGPAGRRANLNAASASNPFGF